MRQTIRGSAALTGVALLVGVMAVGAIAPTDAASGPSLGVVTATTPGAVPNSNITSKAGRRSNYHPKTLSSKITTGSCTAQTEGITINNETRRSQTITYLGSPFFTLKGEQAVGICFSKAGVYVFGLASNTIAKLTVTAA